MSARPRRVRALTTRVAGAPMWLWGVLGLAIGVAIWKRKRFALGLSYLTGSWLERVLARVSSHEGGYTSLNKNSDGAGLSFGLIQWSQRTGALGKLLAAMYDADSTAFQRIFGKDYAALLSTTASGSLAAVGGAVLWQAPWTGRFQEAGTFPPFQQVQRDLALRGEYMAAAISVAKSLGTRTERAVALFLDTAVQQGPGAATSIGNAIRNSSVKGYKPTLQAYATAAAERFRGASAPAKQGRLEWRQVGNEWHAFAGSVDLYKDILRRRTGIVNDLLLKDDPIALG